MHHSHYMLHVKTVTQVKHKILFTFRSLMKPETILTLSSRNGLSTERSANPPGSTWRSNLPSMDSASHQLHDQRYHHCSTIWKCIIALIWLNRYDMWPGLRKSTMSTHENYIFQLRNGITRTLVMPNKMNFKPHMQTFMENFVKLTE